MTDELKADYLFAYNYDLRNAASAATELCFREKYSDQFLDAPNGAAVTYYYDISDNITKIKNSKGQIVVRYYYDFLIWVHLLLVKSSQRNFSGISKKQNHTLPYIL